MQPFTPILVALAAHPPSERSNQYIRARVYTAVMEDLGYDVKVEFPPDPEENKLTY